ADFYRRVQAMRPALCLIFVTGRDLDFIAELCADPAFPAPDYVIGDVGTSVVAWPSRQAVAAVQDVIQARWNGASTQVRALLAEEPGLHLQPVMGPYRVSYYYDPEQLRPSAAEKVRAAGFDCITSAGKFFDVLPAGVHKGSSLRHLLEVCALPANATVTAGDTLNDLGLFESGLPSVAMGNAEAALRNRVQHLDNVYQSEAPGVLGIEDGMRHFGLWHSLEAKA
ncbi:MAG: HAD family hydrolase, partial [Polyangiales bacterium]